MAKTRRRRGGGLFDFGSWFRTETKPANAASGNTGKGVLAPTASGNTASGNTAPVNGNPQVKSTGMSGMSGGSRRRRKSIRRKKRFV